MKRISVYTALLLITAFILTACQQKPEQTQSKTIALFNGENLDGWYTFLKEQGLNSDPEGIFTVQDGMVRILGKEFGYICTEKEYENFKLTVEYKWGDEKFGEDGSKQNSGILYFFCKDSTDRTWPHAIECQLMTGNVGDYVLMGPSMMINGEQGGAGNIVFAKNQDAENPIGEWNTVKIVTKDNSSTHFVNGVQVNQGTDASVHKGKILIQSEGAELFVRKVEIELE